MARTLRRRQHKHHTRSSTSVVYSSTQPRAETQQSGRTPLVAKTGTDATDRPFTIISYYVRGIVEMRNYACQNYRQEQPLLHFTCRTAMLAEMPCTGKLSVKKPSLLILAECRHIDDSPAKQLAAIATKAPFHRRGARRGGATVWVQAYDLHPPPPPPPPASHMKL